MSTSGAESSGCCPPGSHPGLSSSACPPLQGDVVTIGHLKAYRTAVSREGPYRGAVIVAHDIWNVNGGRTRAAADLIAASGDYLVVAPDFYYDGDNVDIHGARYPESGWDPAVDPFPMDWVKTFTPERVMVCL